MVNHHPVFFEFNKYSGKANINYIVNFLGVKTNKAFHLPNYLHEDGEHFVSTDYPPFDEEYFEWIDILESVIESKRHFTMFELGAGYGRWIVMQVLHAKS